VENCKEFTHIPTTPATANIYPILSYPKEKKEHKKDRERSPRTNREAALPF